MDGKGCQTTGQTYITRWKDYLRILKTVEVLKEALATATKAGEDQLEEVRKLVEDEMRGPAPTGEDATRNSGGTLFQRRLPCSPVPLPPGRR